MTILVIDDTLRNTEMVRQLLLSLEGVADALVLEQPDSLAFKGGVDLIIVGSRWLSWARELRARFPEAYIVGRCPWTEESSPSDFGIWGDELRDPALPLTRLVQERLGSAA